MANYPWRESLLVRRNRRSRYVRLKIHPPGRVEVVVPTDFDERGLPQLLERHAHWVEERLRHLGTLHAVPPALPQAIELAAIELDWRVEYRQGRDEHQGCREMANGVLALHASDDGQAQALLKRWLARKAREHLVPWLHQTSEELGLPFSGVAVRGQRTRWGSCSAQGRINLNYALLFLQPDLVRYLFVHELCHTVHLNHSRSYWQKVESVEPNYRLYERALRAAAGELPAWLHFPYGGAAPRSTY